MKLFLELRWTHHSITPSLQGWSLCFFRSCFRQFTSKWKCRFEGWSKGQKFLAFAAELKFINLNDLSESSDVSKNQGVVFVEYYQELTKWSWNPTRVPTALDLHKSTCHVQSTEWLQWKGSADALGAVFLAVFPPLPEHLWVSCIRTPPAQRCSSTRRSNSNLEK